jgi:hypothetical protein
MQDAGIASSKDSLKGPDQPASNKSRYSEVHYLELHYWKQMKEGQEIRIPICFAQRLEHVVVPIG